MNYFKPLDAIDRPTLTTAEAAYFLNRQPQTLRNWAIRNDGPIKCIRMGGRLGWPTNEVRALVAGTHAANLQA
jgi:hypothetical protein